MRSLVLLIIGLLIATWSPAQNRKIVLSDPFEELKEGSGRVLQLANGNTCMVYSTVEEIKIHIYDNAHKLVANKTINSKSMGSKELGFLVSVIEVNKEVVLFVSNDSKLFRINIDGASGNATGKQEIMSGNADYSVLKCPNTDVYVVTKVDSKRILPEYVPNMSTAKYTFFSAKHEIISSANYPSTGNFDITNPIDILLEDKWLIVVTYGYFKKEGQGKSQLILSRLKPGESDFSQQMLDCDADLRKSTGTIKYNPANQKLQLLTSAPIDSRSIFFKTKTTTYYAPLLSYYDPEKLELTKVIPLEGKRMREYFRGPLGIEKEFTGIPSKMIINDDGTTTIIACQTKENSGSHETFVEHIGSTDLNSEGDEIGGYGVLLAQVIRFSGFSLPPYEYFFYEYLTTAGGRYLLVNDFEENIVNYGKRKANIVDVPSNTQTICHSIREQQRNFLFGAPTNEDRFIYGNLFASSYRKDTKTYATLVTERVKREKVSRVAWITFE